MTPLRSPRPICFILFACALALVPSLRAQTPPAAEPASATATITMRMYDARSGRQLVPNNFLIRYDHQDEIHNEHLHIDDEGTGQIVLPAGATFLAVQGTFDKSTEVYINCDTGKERNDRRLHWYSIATILATGVTAPNECFNGKYERPRLDVKPGEYIFYVRPFNWRDPESY